MRFISGQKPQNAIVETRQEIPIDQLSGKEAVADNNEEERQLSLWYVLLHHKALVWWCFFFAVSAIGWYVLFCSDPFYICRISERVNRVAILRYRCFYTILGFMQG